MNPRDPTVASIYLAFFSFAASLWGHDWSAFLASVQLAVFVHKQESVEGISARSVGLYACSHAFRLSSTVWLNGYLPSDTIVDHYLCQIMDLVALSSLLFVLYQCFFGIAKETLLREKDTMRFDATFAFCAILAALLHGDLDDKPLFDTFFFVGIYCNCFALAPQVWLMAKDEYSRQYLSWNYVLPVIGSCVTAILFWEKAYLELTPFECPECTNYVGYTVLFAHFIHAILVLLLALRNAALGLEITTEEGKCLRIHLKIPTNPAPNGPASSDKMQTV